MGVGGLDPVQALLGASLIGSAIGLVLALASGQFIDPRGPWGGGLCVCHKLICPCGCLHIFIWLVWRAGQVFATQVAYLVTLLGMIWAVVLLGETYTLFIWLALVSMLFGIFLVQP